MPRGSNVPAPNEQPNHAVALSLPDDVRADLLRAQAASIETPQQLPRVKIMAQGVGLYEFDDTNETVQSFRGTVLGNHPRNVLWDKRFGQDRSDNPEDSLPACSAPDGRIATPRTGFAHAALDGRRALGNERIECLRCPYNAWGSGNMIFPEKNPRGKACTNQRSVYVVTDDRQMPVELVLPPTSLAALDEYMAGLLNRGIPVQAVVTEFFQTRKEGQGGLRWGVAQFRNVESLEQEAFNRILSLRQQFHSTINPSAPLQQALAGHEPEESEARVVGDDVDDLPF